MAPTAKHPDTDDRIIQFVRDFSASHGYAPTTREIAAEIGLSPSATEVRIVRLVRQGRLTRQPKIARSVHVVTLEDAP